jgi:multidrug resistance efflux pump
MPVKLHGTRWGTPPPHPAANLTSAPRHRPPLTLGRALYFLLLWGGLLLGGGWLLMHALYIRAAGVIERDVDRLAPREVGRIARVAVRPGDTVRKGQPLIYLDYAAGGYITQESVRAGTEAQRRLQLDQRRHELRERAALHRSSIAALKARVKGLSAQRQEVARAEAQAARLVAAGAATQAEVLRLTQRIIELERQRAEAVSEATEKDRALTALRYEERRLERAQRSAALDPPRPADAGLIVAPRDGIVAWVAHREGEVVGPANVVVLLAGGPVRVRAFVQPRDGNSVVAGRSARIELPTGESVAGVMRGPHLLASTWETEGDPWRLPHLPTSDSQRPLLITDVALAEAPQRMSEALAAGAPCEVWVRRDLRALIAPLLASLQP